MRKRSIIALLISSILTMGVLAGCSDKKGVTPTDNKTTTTSTTATSDTAVKGNPSANLEKVTEGNKNEIKKQEVKEINNLLGNLSIDETDDSDLLTQ